MNKRIQPVDRYDEDTGKREVVLVFTCPEARFWKFSHYPTVMNTYTHLKDIPDVTD